MADAWSAWWIDWVGPVVGAAAGVAVHRLPWFRSLEVEVAKLYHFEHDEYGVFRWDQASE